MARIPSEFKFTTDGGATWVTGNDSNLVNGRIVFHFGDQDYAIGMVGVQDTVSGETKWNTAPLTKKAVALPKITITSESVYEDSTGRVLVRWKLAADKNPDGLTVNVEHSRTTDGVVTQYPWTISAGDLLVGDDYQYGYIVANMVVTELRYNILPGDTYTVGVPASSVIRLSDIVPQEEQPDCAPTFISQDDEANTLTVSMYLCEGETTPPSEDPQGPFTSGTYSFPDYRVFHIGPGDGDPMEFHDGSTAELVTPWRGEMHNPHGVDWLVPEADQFQMRQIRLRDGNGSLQNVDAVKFYFQVWGDTTWYTGPEFTGQGWNVWHEHVVSHTGYIRRIRMTKKEDNTVVPTEIEFKGDFYDNPIPQYTPTRYPLINYCGINIFAWDVSNGDAALPERLDAMNGYLFFRDFLDWYLQEQDRTYRFNPTFGGGWFLDNYWTEMKARGYKILACTKNITATIQNTYPSAVRSNNNVPMPYKPEYTIYNGDGTVQTYWGPQYWIDKALPATYAEEAEYTFQMAARYGTNTNVPDAAFVNVRLDGRAWDTDQTRWNTVKKGLGLVWGLEVGNEPNRNWHSVRGNQTAYEYAAELSMNYDGHKGQYHDPANGKWRGAKNADQNIRVVAAGIASSDPSWYVAIAEWSRENRGYRADGSIDVPCDVINFHRYYNNKAGEQWAGTNDSRRGVPPELGSVDNDMRNFVQVVNEYYNGIMIIKTEGGYDWNGVSQGVHETYNADGTVARTRKQVVGDWTVREMLLLAYHGIACCFHYQAYDDDNYEPWSTDQYETSGHLEHVSNERRPVANFIKAIHDQLPNWKFEERISEYPRVERYSNGTQKGYWVWMPTEDNLKQNVTIAVGATQVDRMLLQDNSPTFAVTRHSTSSGSYTVEATETPKFIKVI